MPERNTAPEPRAGDQPGLHPGVRTWSPRVSESSDGTGSSHIHNLGNDLELTEFFHSAPAPAAAHAHGAAHASGAIQYRDGAPAVVYPRDAPHLPDPAYTPMPNRGEETINEVEYDILREAREEYLSRYPATGRRPPPYAGRTPFWDHEGPPMHRLPVPATAGRGCARGFGRHFVRTPRPTRPKRKGGCFACCDRQNKRVLASMAALLLMLAVFVAAGVTWWVISAAITDHGNRY